jgi:uncharacterized low-complexity protein
MTRSITTTLAATAASLLLASAGVATAQPVRGYYTATPATAAAKATFVTRNTVWKCADGICAAPKAPSQPGIMCELVAKSVGTLSAFTANNTPFDAEALAKCNAKAR